MKNPTGKDIWKMRKGVYCVYPHGDYTIIDNPLSLTLDFHWADLNLGIHTCKCVDWEALFRDPVKALAPYKNIIEEVWRGCKHPFMQELRNKMLGRGTSPVQIELGNFYRRDKKMIEKFSEDMQRLMDRGWTKANDGITEHAFLQPDSLCFVAYRDDYSISRWCVFASCHEWNSVDGDGGWGEVNHKDLGLYGPWDEASDGFNKENNPVD